MNQRQLRRTIESFFTKKFDSSAELLTHVVNQIVQHANIDITGGRVWKLRSATYSYELIAQVGAVQKIRDHYTLRADRYDLFRLLPRHRTVVLHETDQYLRRKGILRYSATGVGDIVRIRNTPLYQYVLSFNTSLSQEQIGPTLDIIGITVTNMLTAQRAERRSSQMKHDLERAREIQQSILPDHKLRFHTYEIFGISAPDKIVGGDFFDYIESDENDRLTVVIGDAASKGIVAAVQSLYVSGALRMGIGYQTKLSTLLQKINTLVHRMFTSERFLTLCVAELTNDERGLCIYINAGHPRPLLYHATTRQTETLEPTGTIIGPFPQLSFRRESAVIGKGDVLLLYTDGVSESMGAGEEQYTENRLSLDLDELHAQTPQKIANDILERVQKHGAKGKNQDDKTVVIIKRVR
jgi:sigma-B regulation protein RsbU (phosphoserine phosphatase)